MKSNAITNNSDNTALSSNELFRWFMFCISLADYANYSMETFRLISFNEHMFEID